ncbi:tolloid-like protein 2 isoform X2 [Acropora muricata]|uniref:tolloid-like protein 2 isoform X2 n=1 Tax=Acropora muricata TaxID=159855 RepID=UPI0034E4DCB4
MASFKSISFAIVHVFDCPDGITNITGKVSGEIVYPISGTYGANETKCWRIEVPKPYIGIGLYYHRYEIEECPNCACDRFDAPYAFRYSSLWPGGCGRYSPGYLSSMNRLLGSTPIEELNKRSVYLRLKTDDSIEHSGINISFIAVSDSPGRGKRTFLNVSSGQITTPKFGSKKYPASFNWEWYLLAPEGHQIHIKFESFELEQSEHCQNDYLEIREEYSWDSNNPRGIEGAFSAVLARPKCGTDSPGEIHSAGNLVWVHFRSDSNATTTYKGFKATFTSSGNRTLSISFASSIVFLISLITVTAI